MVAWLCLQPSPSVAASRDARERAARTACLAGDYSKGIAILSELFVASNDATYIYNQGRCLEQNARYTEAIARFQEYLNVGRRLSERDKAETAKHIAFCETMLAKQPQARVVAPSPEPVNVAQQEPTPSPALPTETLVQRSPTSAPPGTALSSAGSKLRTTGLVLAGIGGAAVVAGVLLNLKVNGMADDFGTLDGYTDAKESDRQNYETFGWVGYGVGGACLATGAVLYFLGRRVGAQDPVVAVAPSFSSGGVAATLNGRF